MVSISVSNKISVLYRTKQTKDTFCGNVPEMDFLLNVDEHSKMDRELGGAGKSFVGFIEQ